MSKDPRKKIAETLHLFKTYAAVVCIKTNYFVVIVYINRELGKKRSFGDNCNGYKIKLNNILFNLM